MTRSLYLGPDEYHTKATATDHTAVGEWTEALAQWGQNADLERRNDGQVLVFAARWAGEAYEIRVLPTGSYEFVWVVPPIPPPAQLMRLAVPEATP